MFFTNEHVFLFWSHLDVNFQFRHFDTKLSEGYRKMERDDHFNVFFFLIFLRKRSTVRNTNVVVFLLKMTGWALNTFYSSSVCWKLLSYLVISSSFCVCVYFYMRMIISICVRSGTITWIPNRRTPAVGFGNIPFLLYTSIHPSLQ